MQLIRRIRELVTGVKGKGSSHFGGSNILSATAEACGTTYRSPRLLLGAIRQFHAFDSVADLGCGRATFLREAKALGAGRVMGYDLAEIDIDERFIDASEFTEVDLGSPQDFGARYDLVISVEVAEHLHEAHSETYMDNLCSLGDVILFSAATPYQGGMHHVNERWVEYWHEKFTRRGFECFDCLRPQFWNDPRIAWYYRQNCMIYARGDRAAAIRDAGLPAWGAVSLVHPEMLIKSVHLTGPAAGATLASDVAAYYRHVWGEKSRDA